jgi:hypothetical protein
LRAQSWADPLQIERYAAADELAEVDVLVFAQRIDDEGGDGVSVVLDVVEVEVVNGVIVEIDAVVDSDGDRHDAFFGEGGGDADEEGLRTKLAIEP